MYDPAGKFDWGDEAIRGACLVTVQHHWRLTHPGAGLMPKDSKHKPKCRRCRKIIRDSYFWSLDEHTYCRACGDKEIAPYCLCGCKQVECPVCQATGGGHQFPNKRRTKVAKKPGKKAPPSQAAHAPADLKKAIVEMLERKRRSIEEEYGPSRTMVNPFTLEPGFVLPDPYPKGVTERQLRAFRSRTGVELPDDVREWLRITNGASGFFGIGSAPKGSNVEEIWRLTPEWRENRWIPVGRDDFGNFFVRVVPESGKRGGVFLVEATISDELVYAAASDTLHFAWFDLRHSEALQTHKTSGWPQDESFVLSQDPELAHVEGAPFYWEL
jgi:hypothetical protein